MELNILLIDKDLNTAPIVLKNEKEFDWIFDKINKSKRTRFKNKRTLHKIIYEFQKEIKKLEKEGN